jgi:hypothetical protein
VIQKKILVACHSKEQHGEMKTIIIDGDDYFEDDGTLYDISYVDDSSICKKTNDQYVSIDGVWDTPANTFDYIWFEYCPLWNPIDPRIALAIFFAAVNSLKEGGKIITYRNPHPYASRIVGFILHIIPNLSVETISEDDYLPIYMLHKDKSEITGNLYYIFTKNSSSATSSTKKQTKK